MNTYTPHQAPADTIPLGDNQAFLVRLPRELVLPNIHRAEELQQEEIPFVTVTLLTVPGTHSTALGLWKNAGGTIRTRSRDGVRGEICISHDEYVDRITLCAAGLEEFNVLYRQWFYQMHQRHMAGLQIAAITVAGAKEADLHTLGWLRGICRANGIMFESTAGEHTM